MNKKNLITGGAGFIGSHVVRLFVNKYPNYQIINLDKLTYAGNLENLKDVENKSNYQFIKGDIVDATFINSLFESEKFDGVIHLAAYKAVGESVQYPLKYYQNNLGSLSNLLQTIEHTVCKNIVFSSSCTVYGQPDELPVNEQAPFKPAESPYGNTKQIGEEILYDCAKANAELNVISLRYFNPIGAHASAKIGELPNGVPNNLVPYITQTAAGLRDKLNVWGNDYNTPDGSCIRDFINVVDLAKAHVVAIERLLTNKNKNKNNFEFFNIGTGVENSVLEVINSFEKVSGLKLNYQLADRRPGDIEQIYANTQYANNELGWRAEKELDETILSAWNWQLELIKKKC